MSRRLWLIGGTEESRWLVDNILMRIPGTVGLPPPLLISVTTASARRLYPENPAVMVWVGKLTEDQTHAFIEAHNIGAILDASHPFATDISHRAVALAQQYGLPYLRYERPQVTLATSNEWLDATGRPGNILLPQLTDLFAGSYLEQERTLLTLGYRMLSDFALWQSRGKLFVRILPSQPALAAALAAGFTSDRIIALRPPISMRLERALWQQWQITQVVTKASGQAGGEDRKQAIAAELGIRLIRLARPVLSYPTQTDCLDVAIEFAIKHAQKHHR